MPTPPIQARPSIIERFSAVFDVNQIVGEVAAFEGPNGQLGVVSIVFDQQDFEFVFSDHIVSFDFGSVK